MRIPKGSEGPACERRTRALPELAGSCSRNTGAEQAGSSMAEAETVLAFVGCAPTATETVEAGNDDLVSSHWATDGARGGERAAQGAGRGEARSYLEPGRRKLWARQRPPNKCLSAGTCRLRLLLVLLWTGLRLHRKHQEPN